MAVVRIPEAGLTISDKQAVADHLATCGIYYQQWRPEHDVAADAPAEEVLSAYAKEIEELKAQGGYVTADVIDVNPQTPGLDTMLAKFNREHWHSEDEVRFIVKGRGVFHIHGTDGRVFGIEVEGGDPEYIEGAETMVPYKGRVDDVIQRYLAGLRSSMSYMDARTLEEYRRNASFLRLH